MANNRRRLSCILTITFLLFAAQARIGADLASRLSVYPTLPPGGKYELVLDGAEHSAFTDRALPGETEKRSPNHHLIRRDQHEMDHSLARSR